MSSYRGKAVIVVSDLHVNSTTAVCLRRFNLDDGGSYYASPIQRELYKYWKNFIFNAAKITEGFKRIIVFNGDVGELDIKRRSNQLITINKSTILRMVYDVIEPLIDIADKVAVIRGTSAHTGKSAWLEEELGRDLDNDLVIKSSEQVFSHYHFRRKIGSVRFDIAHHARMGGLRHTQKNYAIRLAQDTMDKYRDRGEIPPDVVIRSHNHRRADSGHNWPSFAMYTPSWQLPNEYIHRIGAENDSPDIGGDIFLCTNELPNTKGSCIIYPNFIWYPFMYKLNNIGKRQWKRVNV